MFSYNFDSLLCILFSQLLQSFFESIPLLISSTVVNRFFVIYSILQMLTYVNCNIFVSFGYIFDLEIFSCIFHFSRNANLLFFHSVFVFLFSFLTLFQLKDHCYVRVHNNSSMPMSHCHYNIKQERQFLNLIIIRSNLIVTVMMHVFKFHFSCFRELLTSYYFLLPNFILRPLLSRKCMIIYLLFLSGNVHPSPVPAPLYINLITSLL